MTRYRTVKTFASVLSSISLATILRGLVRKQLSVLSRFMAKTQLTRFSRILTRLEQIPNLSKVNRNFVAKLKINYGTEQILSKLSNYGLTPKAASQIFNQ